MTDVKILYINKVDLLKNFWKETLEQMKMRHCHLVELDFIIGKINKYNLMKK